MDRETFEQLLNREVDGVLSPEEAARLNAYTAQNPSAMAEQQAFHRMHRAFRAQERFAPPVGLADRIADRVLQGAPPAARKISLSAWRMGRIAAAIALMAAVGLGGLWAGHQDPVRAGEQVEQRWRENTTQHWIEWGLSPEVAERIVAIRLPFWRGEEKDAGDRETGLVLRVLQQSGHLDRYCDERNLTPQEAQSLIDRAR